VIERLRRGASEDGFSLPETVAALLILSTAVLAIIGAFGTGIIASDVNKKDVTVDAAVRSYAEAIASHWQDGCAPDYAPNEPGQTHPVGYTPPPGVIVSVVNVEWWTGATAGDMFSGTCPGPTSPPAQDRRGLQRVTIEGHAADERAREELQVVVRRGNDQ
jgi:hypothetical protein